MPTNERPGIYSEYQVSSAVTGSAGGGVVGLAAQASAGTAGTVVRIASYGEAAAAFGAGSTLAKLAGIALRNGAMEVHAVRVASSSTSAYTAAFAALQADTAVRYVICDSRTAAIHAAMQSSITSAPEHSKYRIGIVENSGTVSDMVSAAAALNCERMVLCTPGTGDAGEIAAAVAGVLAGSSDPALPLGGAVLQGVSSAPEAWDDTDVNTLVRGGVTPVEIAAGEVSVVRGVTTRTTTAGVSDATWRELSTILVVDDVIPTVRAALRSRFARSKNTAQTRGAIRTQVVSERENKRSREIIDSYDSITAVPSTEDPTVCVVSFAFTVAHGLNQIRLSADITV